ncbi:MAG: CHASE2 domain-containing protein [Leptolyngbyaceae cyanobacterium SM1_4_3]|nr:CHASE2 domain-containing protein [Leptolyngbyaceae cyanobacterium SM1_4_3]
MAKLIVLSFGEGNLSNGFAAVTVQLWNENDTYPAKIIGRLAAAPKLAELYRQWRLLYLALYQRLGFGLRLEIETADVTNVSEIELGDLCQQLSDQLNHWLNSEPFQGIDRWLRTQLHPSDWVRFIIETNDPLLRRLPWHLWQFFEDYPKAEVALSTPTYQRSDQLPTGRALAQVKILAILGNSQEIDVERDRATLRQLSRDAEVEFLVEPSLEELNESLWQGWDILFYAGHSSNDEESERGILQLNQTDRLTLEQLKYALRRAIAQGLKLAIFNSCDGLGLAQSLADLHIPQVIVMREPVPDVVAQTFLRHFLTAFAGGQSLYASVREARERLQGLEDRYPCATWLPIICQNPAESPPSWQSLRGEIGEEAGEQSLPQFQSTHAVSRTATFGSQSQRRRSTLSAIWRVCLISGLVTSLVVGGRSLGLLQPFELRAFDQLVQLRPAEPPDDRLLIVTVDDADLQYQEQQGMVRKGSLSDQALVQLLQKVEPYQPRMIASDIYHEFEFEPELASYLQQRNHIINVCRIGQAGDEATQISSPPDIPTERLGFTNSVVDPDGVIRRHLLGMPSDDACPTSQSLSLRAAMGYLNSLDIPLQFTEAGVLQIGEVSFPKLEFNAGGYQLSAAEANGYQALLHYRSAPFAQIPLRKVLDDSLTSSQLAELVKDRIILIGVTIDNVDSHFVPYRNRLMRTEIPGVVIQAHMTSQIISAVLDQRPLLWWLPQWLEAVWIGCWAWMGGMLVWWRPLAGISLRSPSKKHSPSGKNRTALKLGLTIGLSLIVLHSLCFMALLWGGWLPLVPAALALMISGGSVAIAKSKIPTKP